VFSERFEGDTFSSSLSISVKKSENNDGFDVEGPGYADTVEAKIKKIFYKKLFFCHYHNFINLNRNVKQNVGE